ncbi:MAG: winged helix-turn-helix domain-containing protein [Acetivibrio ethanolgignens]
MNTQEKTYITASELSERLGISVGQAYKIIRELNSELKKQGYITVAGKCPCRYMEKKWYGFGNAKEN